MQVIREGKTKEGRLGELDKDGSGGWATSISLLLLLPSSYINLNTIVHCHNPGNTRSGSSRHNPK